MAELREIAGFPGYLIGDDGSVWTTKRKGGNDRTAGKRGPPLRMRTSLSKKGYVVVGLDRNGRNHARYVHALVLEAFVGPKPEGLEACHYPDRDKTNNRVGNLRWDTHAENMKDQYRDRGPVTEKRCCGCGRVKPVAEFYRDKRASDGLASRCSKCSMAQSIRTRDPEKKRKANREYMRRRAAARRQSA